MFVGLSLVSITHYEDAQMKYSSSISFLLLLSCLCKRHSSMLPRSVMLCDVIGQKRCLQKHTHPGEVKESKIAPLVALCGIYVPLIVERHPRGLERSLSHQLSVNSRTGRPFE